MAGRREVPVDPDAGPVQQFAYELRRLRRDAGRLTYRAMARSAGYSVTTLSRAAAGGQLPSLPVALAYATACGGDRAEWEARWRRAVAESASVSGSEGDGEHTDPPYRGLSRFEAGDRERFFGRDPIVRDLSALVRSRRVVAVVGGSGTGKSSLLRAGLVPLLRNGTPPPTPDSGSPAPDTSAPEDRTPDPHLPAALRILTPGEHPHRTHRSLLVPVDAPGETVVIVDQFEETFTLCTDAVERRRFIELLLTALRPDSRLRVVIAVRADFYGRCSEYRRLADALRDASLLIGPMTRGELREAITRPAQAEGLTVERGLTTRIVDEIAGQPGGLPLMSHALLETWRRRRGRALTLASYEAAGGVHGAIAITAEDTYSRLSPDQARLARQILLRLITPGDGVPDTRRPVDRRELDPDGAKDTAVVLERLASARLIALDEQTVDLAHEALITAWPRLSGWIDEDRRRLRVHRKLTEAARAWEELSHDSGALYRGLRLAEAREVFGPAGRPGELTALESGFLAASGAGRIRERRRKHALIVSVSVLLALTMVAGLAAWQRSQTGERRLAEATSRRVASLAQNMRYADPLTAMRLSVAAWRISPTAEARAALFGAVTQPEQDSFQLPGDRSEGTPHLSADGRTLAVADPSGSVRIWDVEGRKQTHRFGMGLREDVHGFAADGRRLLSQTVQGQWQLWDTASGRPTLLPFHSGDTLSADGPKGDAFLAVTRDGVTVWAPGEGRRLFQRPGDTRRALLSEDGRLVVLCTAAGALELWDLRDRRRLPVARGQAISPAACGSGARILWLESRTDRLIVHTDTRIRIWEPATGRELPAVPITRTFADLAGSDGKFLVTADDQQILVWRVGHRGAPVFRYPLRGGRIQDLVLDTRRGVIRYVEPYAGSAVRTIFLGNALDPRWRAGSGAPATPRDPYGSGTPGELTAMALGPVGHDTLATGGLTGWVTIWDRAYERRTGTFHATATGPGAVPEAVTALAYSPDGRILATGGATGTVRLWDAVSTHPLGGPLLTSGDTVRSLRFGRDGKRLTVAGAHTPPRSHPIDPELSIAVVCERSGGGLRAAEWKTHIPALAYRDTC
ncbi:nSTAND1 domain-containing NTPase [Streptomyces sp. NPDC055078]